MWGNDNKHKTEKVDTLIGQNTEINGDVIFSGGLHIDGKVKGNIIAEPDSSAVLVLTDKGYIEGEIRVPYLVADGKIRGDVHAQEMVELGTGASISGDVYYDKIEMVMGAEVNGNLIHLNEAAKPHLVHSTDIGDETNSGNT